MVLEIFASETRFRLCQVLLRNQTIQRVSQLVYFRYVKAMPPSYSDQITIEKSPCYIVEHNTFVRMHALNSSLKVSPETFFRH